MEYTPENLEYAVSVFYNGEQADRAKAHAWLTAAQRVPEAWTFVWELLQPNKGTEIQFYAATTLHTKILRCWNEVPPESHDELKEKLLQAVYTYSKGPKIVTNRLCISLAAFILQQGTTDLAAILRPLSAAENTTLLLEVLTVIPEEYNSMTMGSVLRSKNRSALTQACPAVLDDLLRYLHSVYEPYKAPPPDDVVQLWLSAAVCACSWLTLGGEEAPEGGAALPERLPLCAALLHAVRVLYTWNEAVSDTALDVCEACLTGVRAASGPDSSRQPVAALQLVEQLAALAAPILARDNRPDSINEELLSALITCLVGVGETHAGALVRAVEAGPRAPAPARQLLELLLAAQAAPGHYPAHEARSNLVFGFWYTLQDEILNVMENTNKITPVWRDVFSRLLTILVAKSEAPPDSALSKDDQELLRCYRQDIADTVMYCVGILGDWCWTTVEAAYEAADSDERREAALHVFLALADSAPHRRAPDSLPRLLQRAVAAAGAPRGRMLDTALDCLGSYAGWVASLEGPRGSALGRECVSAAGAALPRAGPAAALALRKLCADCQAPAAALATDIVTAAQSEQARSETWVRRQLLSAAGSALAAASPDVAGPLLQDLARTLVEDLNAQALEPGRALGAAECCAALLGALPARPALGAELCAALLPALPAFARHPQLVEPMFHILKQTVSSLMDDCRPLVGDVGRLTAEGFTAHPCAAGLDVVKLLVLVFGSEWAEAARLLHVCVALSARRVAPEPAAQPDLAEALFALLRALTKKKPQYIDWIEELLSELVELGVLCVRMWEAGAARSACLWLGALAGARPGALQPHAPLLTAAALRCIGGATPRNQIEPLAELLLALNRAAWGAGAGGDLAAWLRQALAVAGFPTHHATDTHKHKFIAAVIKEKSSKRRLLESVQEFSLVCRGLVGTEYARQTIASKQLVA